MINLARDYAITTLDNVNNPFTHPDEWLAFDMEKHYNTNEWLAFYAKVSHNLEKESYDEEAEYAARKLLERNPYGIHVKVYEDEAEILIPIFNKVYEENRKEYESLVNNKQSINDMNSFN